MGFLLALIPAIAWGSIGLVSGKLGGNAYQQTLGMTFGALVFGIGTLIVMRPVLDTKIWLLGIVSGLFWALGQGQQFQSMKYMGVSMTMPNKNRSSFRQGCSLLRQHWPVRCCSTNGVMVVM
jgi:glucose uptake protein